MSASSSTSISLHQFPGAPQVLKWKINSDVEVISYPQGRGLKALKPVSIADTKLVSQRIQEAAKARENGEGCIRLEGYGGLLQPAQDILTCIVPETKEIVTRFSRFPDSEDDLSTPFFCTRSKKLVDQIGIPLSVFAFRPRACKLIDTAIKNYLEEQIPQMDAWMDFSHEHYFKKWALSPETIDGYEAFSSLSWGITSHFILGIPLHKHHDYSVIWNKLFAPNTTLIYKAKLLLIDYKKGLCPFVYEQIAKVKTQLPEFSSTIIAYCEREKIVERLIDELNPKELSEGERLATEHSTTLKDHLLFSIIIMIAIGMQENYAFTVTETLRKVSNDFTLLHSCYTDKKNITKAIQETLRMTPPAGHHRQVRWDTTIIYKSKSYELNKGDLLATHPLFIGHHEQQYSFPDVFNISRKSKEKGCPFGKGPHQCPGESLAMIWMSKTILRLLSSYLVKTSDPENLDFRISFTMKHEPKIELKLSPINPKGIILLSHDSGCIVN